MLGLLARAGALQYKHVGPVPACTELQYRVQRYKKK